MKIKKTTKQIVDECNKQYNWMKCKACHQHEWCDVYYKQFSTNPFQMNDPFVQKMVVGQLTLNAYSDSYYLTLED